ncbi:hypothetical protein [Natronospora cellulosivora (SeqCode)]
MKMYLSDDLTHKVKSELYNGSYYIDKKEFEALELEAYNGKITAHNVYVRYSRLQTNNGKVNVAIVIALLGLFLFIPVIIIICY